MNCWQQLHYIVLEKRNLSLIEFKMLFKNANPWYLSIWWKILRKNSSPILIWHYTLLGCHDFLGTSGSYQGRVRLIWRFALCICAFTRWSAHHSLLGDYLNDLLLSLASLMWRWQSFLDVWVLERRRLFLLYLSIFIWIV